VSDMSDKLQTMVGSLVKALDNNEKIATPILAAKLNKAIKAYPEDQTIGAMWRVIGKMADNNTLFIRRVDLKDLYHKLYSRNTKFAQLFTEEMGTVESLPATKTMERDDASEIQPYAVQDQILANALTSVFDKNAPLKMYSQPVANLAKKTVAAALDDYNLNPSNLEVVNGSDKFIILKADYETPKGITSFYVPLEIHNNKLSPAFVFMGNGGPQELNHSNLKSYITSFAGSKLQVSGTAILNVLTSAASEDREISGAEMALTKLNASRQQVSGDGIVGQKLDQMGTKDVALPKSGEFASFEKQFASPAGQASFHFGNKVKVAHDHIVRELVSFGHKNPQVAVAKSDDNTIFYSVSLDGGRVGFTVPVKITAGKISAPALLLCNGTVSSFSQDGIDQLYQNNASDFKAAAIASPQFELTPAALLNNIRQAVAEGNHAGAEDALNVLANTGDAVAYAKGLQAFMGGLAGTKTAEVKGCSKLIKNSTSEHPICSHTGLAAHKVYQDKDGNCRPLYRQGVDETYQGAIFNNSKIFG
jgi:hypothetical protein